MATPAGTLLGRYEIRSSIGAGGMGEVYLARDVRLDRPVALKLLSGEMTRYEDRVLSRKLEPRLPSIIQKFSPSTRLGTRMPDISSQPSSLM